MRRVSGFVLAGAVIGLALAVVSCGPAGQNTSAQNQRELRISVLAWMTGKYDFAQAATKFEANHPGVKVTITKLDTVDTTSNLLQWSQGKTTIDLALGGSRENIVPYVAKNLLVPFDDKNFFNAGVQKADFIPSLLQLGNINGTQYMIPMMGEVIFIVVDKPLMKKAGLVDAQGNVEESKTLDQLFEMAKKATIVKNGNVVQYGLAIDWGANFMAYNYMAGLQGLKGNMYGDDGKTLDFLSPQAKELMNFWRSLVKAGYTPTDTFADVDAARTNFKAGKVAMHITAASRWLEAEANLGKGNVTIIPVPGTDKNGSFAYIHGAIIPKLSPNQDLALAFIKEELLSSDFQLPAMNTWGKMSPLVAHFQLAKAPEWKTIMAATQTAATCPLYKDYPKLDILMQNELQKMITGQQSVDATTANLGQIVTSIDKSTGL